MTRTPAPCRALDIRVMVFLALMATPAGAGDEASSGKSRSIQHLVDRIECIEWRRNRLDANRARLSRDSQPGWTHAEEIMWRIEIAIRDFESARIAPFIDDEARRLLVRTYWPNGVSGPGISEKDRQRRLRKCRNFLDIGWLRAAAETSR